MICKGTAGVEEESKERKRTKRDSKADIIQNHIQGHSDSKLDINRLLDNFIAPKCLLRNHILFLPEITYFPQRMFSWNFFLTLQSLK